MMKKLLTLYLLSICALLLTGHPTVLARGAKAGIQQQDNTVTGTILDENGVGLPGVTVVAVGTSAGTITDLNGVYNLRIPDGATQISYSFIGYITQTRTINGQSVVDLSMEPDVDVLEEVVVTGYGQTQNKQLVSSAISNIEPKEMIEDRPIARLEQALQGATPAVVVLQESGSPGAPLTIRMRGVSSANSSQPLTLMNGFQLPDMSHVNPNDVGGIQVFKDAASAAIYGARGANGVINMQNKSGQAGETIVSVSGYYGVQQLAGTGDYLTAREYAEYYNNSLRYRINEGQSITGFRGVYTDAEMALLPNDTWIERVSQDAAIHDLHVSASGGDERTTFYVSAGTFDQQGIIGPTGFNRNTFNLNLTTKLKENVELNVLTSYSNNQREFISENSENSRLMSSVASLPAVYPTYSEAGDPFNTGRQGVGLSYNGVPLNAIAEFGNPALGFRHTDQKYTENTLFSNALLKWEVIDGLKVNTSVGYMGKDYFMKGFAETFGYPDQGYAPQPNALWETRVESKYYQMEGYLSYDKQIGMDHSISAILGSSILHSHAWTYGRNAIGLSQNTWEDANFSNISSDGTSGISPDQFTEKNTLSYYGRLQYNYKEKYLLDATVRMDGSSNFGPENKYGFFPSVNAGWVLSEENFLQAVNSVDMLKLRASWGINGIDNIPAYRYVKTATKQGSVFTIDSTDPAIKWEEVSQLNFGLDVDLFGNKIGLTIDHYYKTTTDMLVEIPQAGFIGEGNPTKNAATVKNIGWEFVAMYRDRAGESFKYNVALNVGLVKNEVTDLGGGAPLIGAGTRVFAGAPLITRSDVGDPIASFYGFKFEGLDDKGNPIYEDISGPDGSPDGEISDADRQIIGNPYPNITFGINLGLEWKGFDFTAFLSGVQGNDVVNASMGYGFAYSNRTTRVLDGWSHSDPTGDVMRASAQEVVNHEFSDYYIEDGSYMRVKNLTLGYTIPAFILEKIRVKNLRIYASANNIWTLTNYSGYDPEIGSNNDPRDVGIDRGFYPQPRSFMGGFQLTF